MTKRSGLFVGILISLSILFASCSSGVLGAEYGTISIRLKPAAGNKALADAWPMGGVPVFSSVTVGVTDADGNEVAQDIQPVTGDGSITLRVQAGSGLKVEFEGVPDWTATAEAYPEYTDVLPTLATGYSGISDEFDLEVGGTANVTVRLSVSATKIVIPNPSGNWTLNTADSIEAASLDAGVQLSGLVNSSTDTGTFFRFDRFGTLYLARDFDGHFEVEAYASLENSSSILATETFSITGLALDADGDRLFVSAAGDGDTPAYVDLSTETPTNVYITLPNEQYQNYIDSAIAVDSEGYLYIAGTNIDYDRVLLKLSLEGTPSEGSIEAVVVSQASFSDLGLTYSANYDGSGSSEYTLSIRDMTVLEDVLYVIADDVETPEYSYNLDYARSKGKLIAISTSNLYKLWEAGWAGDSVKYPESESTQFYGPTRLVGIAPKKIYIVDEGGVWDGMVDTGYRYSDIDRIVEIDTSSHTISGIGLEDQSSFLEDYASIYIYC